MKTPSKPLFLVGPAILLALFAVGVLAGRALALPLPAPVVGLTLVLLGLRVGVVAAAIEEPSGAPARPTGPRADARGPALRAANG
jgi:putative effector of murein hydrolase LrgA (UPF0299 family)